MLEILDYGTSLLKQLRHAVAPSRRTRVQFNVNGSVTKIIIYLQEFTFAVDRVVWI